MLTIYSIIPVPDREKDHSIPPIHTKIPARAAATTGDRAM